jgi:hypothetical protein
MDRFFSNLARRLNSENDISDITWALCRTNDHFQKFFLGYCFENSITRDIDFIEREIPEEDFRLDFLIQDIDGSRYLLEVKKYDRNVHKEYKKLNFNKRAFIANYSMAKQSVYDHTVTWHNFIDTLMAEIKKNTELNNSLIKGYLAYLIGATDYYKGATMNLTGFQSLDIFVKTLNDIVNQSKIQDIRAKYSCDAGYSGIDIKFSKSKKSFHIWYGITYFANNERPYLVLEFFDGCSKAIKEKLLKTKKGKYFLEPYVEEMSVIVEMQEKHFEILCDSKSTFEEQKKCLKNFFEEVIDMLINV